MILVLLRLCSEGDQARDELVPVIALVARHAAPSQTKSAIVATAVPSVSVVAAAPASVLNAPVIVPTGVDAATDWTIRFSCPVNAPDARTPVLVPVTCAKVTWVSALGAVVPSTMSSKPTPRATGEAPPKKMTL